MLLLLPIQKINTYQVGKGDAQAPTEEASRTSAFALLSSSTAARAASTCTLNTEAPEGSYECGRCGMFLGKGTLRQSARFTHLIRDHY